MTLLLVVLTAALSAQAAELPTLLLPPGEGAWVVRIVTTGGFTGRGSGNFTASSDGGMLCAAATCPDRLALESQRSLSRLITAIPLSGSIDFRPSPLHPGTCSDCVTTTMTVRRRAADGERTINYTWDVSNAKELPEEALRLHSAILTLAAARPSR